MMERTILDLQKDVKRYEAEKEELENSKEEIVKLEHKLSNKIESLKLTLNKLNLNTEAASELSVADEINRLKNDYISSRTKSSFMPPIPKTHILGIDNILEYMQTECLNNNIDFHVFINDSIHFLIENIVPQADFETLIGDHIRDAIIAVNSSSSSNREIIVKLGIIDNCYTFSVIDTGIEFEIDTLLNLGIKKVTTHEKDGGNGIGFMTTFDTMRKCNASLIIKEKEPSKTNFTKSVTIRFDSKGEYVINSYRPDKIRERG
ncbi:MAG: hypothetical protein LBL91_03875 [Lachnospiraceae bacterium]|nr:hypothetical protein [Lachnospiraceae bacterium]